MLCACLGLSKYQFITNLTLKGTIHWYVRTGQFTQCSLVPRESHDRIWKQKEFHNMFLELLIKITAGWQERHMANFRCMATVFCLKKKSSLHQECECVHVCARARLTRKASNPDKPLMRCFQSSLASYFIALSLSPCNTAMNKCNQSNWLPEIFFNALLRTRYICRANKYKISVPVGSIWWEWVICLAYERCMHFRS